MSKRPKRITVKVDDDLHHKVRVKSVMISKPLSEVIREALRAWLAEAQEENGGNDEQNI